MKINPPHYVIETIQILESLGFEAYIVGGCLRDSLLRQTPKDWDIATNAKPNEILKIFTKQKQFKTLKIGLKYGTIGVLHIPTKHLIEITTFRIDGDYTNKRQPDSVSFSDSLVQDLSRRDFSINALAYTPKENKIYDYFCGIQDIESKVIRCVGEPQMRLQEDALRILRALRFIACLPYGFSIESTTKQAILDSAPNLAYISKERIQAEFNRLIMGEFARETISEYSKIFAHIFPYLAKSLHSPKKALLQALSPLDKAPQSLPIRLCVFFDTLCNLASYAHTKDELAYIALKSLKYSNKTISLSIMLLKHYDITIQPNKPHLKHLANTLGIENLQLLLQALALKQDSKTSQNLQHILDEILAHNECFQMQDLAYNGSDIKALANTHNIPLQDKDIGTILHILLASVIDEKLANQKEILAQKTMQLLHSFSNQ